MDLYYLKMYWSVVDNGTRQLLTLAEIEESADNGHHVEVEWW